VVVILYAPGQRLEERIHAPVLVDGLHGEGQTSGCLFVGRLDEGPASPLDLECVLEQSTRKVGSELCDDLA
jgi:hypothetical protein